MTTHAPSLTASQQKSSVTVDDLLPDALAGALGEIVASFRREMQNEIERRHAEQRAIIAELKADVAEYKAMLRDAAAGEFHQLRDAMGTELSQMRDAVAQLRDGPPGPQGEPGKDAVVDYEQLAGLIDDVTRRELDRKIDELPEPEPGKSVDPDELWHMIKSVVATAVDPDEIKEEVLAALPPPEKGEKGDPGIQGPPGDDGSPGAPGAPGKDGLGLAGAFVSREGHLVVTMTNGETKDLGVVVGRDGVSVEDLSFEYDGERTVTARGKQVETATWVLPVPIDRGVFKSDQPYQRGDVVTYGGSAWVSQRATTGERPGEENDAWRLAVKRGRDGKDGKPGERGEKGEKGDPFVTVKEKP